MFRSPQSQHSAKDTEDNLERVIPMAQLLTRLDSGFDSAALMVCVERMNQPEQVQVDFLIKWNPRSTDRAEMAAQLDACAPSEGAVQWTQPREGKRVALWEQPVRVEGIQRPVRRVLRLVERTISASGQHLIVSEYELDGSAATSPSDSSGLQVASALPCSAASPSPALTVPQTSAKRNQAMNWAAGRAAASGASRACDSLGEQPSKRACNRFCPVSAVVPPTRSRAGMNVNRCAGVSLLARVSTPWSRSASSTSCAIARCSKRRSSCAASCGPPVIATTFFMHAMV